MWSVAGIVAMTGSFAFGSGPFLPKPRLYSVERANAESLDMQAMKDKALEFIAALEASATSVNVAGGKSARLSDPAEPPRLMAKIDTPAAERFGRPASGPAGQPQTILAYADPTPGGAASAALSTWLAASLEENPDASQEPDLETGDDVAALPGFDGDPSDIPLPQLRPRGEEGRKLAEQMAESAVQPVEEPPLPKSAPQRETSKPQVLAYARPDNPTEKARGGGFGKTLRDLFGGGPKPEHGVAVYDISAAKVYMPDGSVLEAHSGIGKMADNPRYANVKMKGPTPPHTYNLKMREKRFHGVEAIRMLPVDGRNKYGRDGFLTHSYLLRGREGESHGCVAFKNYDRFLKAFKQGKVKQLVVVPSRGQATMQLVSNGKSI
ncbi:hypothetical protein C5748_05110 [Phyllobacterium phragmitis]|uniref:Tlde1 domain-containing protein n=2 Tax=Phyllobacterium phragmitis TaxID=2670329 RepID=A0A2S9IW73_9HYPH|nr:hypothetical protein C5748_05110 [Phyllobacterium phragmitis]